MKRHIAAVTCALLAMPAYISHAVGEADEQTDDGSEEIVSGVTVTSVATVSSTTPQPRCWWEPAPATTELVNYYRTFWRRIDGGAFADVVLIYVESGSLKRTFSDTGVTDVLQIRECVPADDERAGSYRWDDGVISDLTVLWTELTAQVRRRVPAPEPDIGYTIRSGERTQVFINVGLWLAVTNADDVVARAEIPPAAWSETRAVLDRIEFDPGNGDSVVVCDGPGELIADVDTVEEGPCGYTYRSVDDLGDRTITMNAVWEVTNATSAGDAGRQPDIVTSTTVDIEVLEIQTVGGPGDDD